jgi:hypothetical protein
MTLRQTWTWAPFLVVAATVVACGGGSSNNGNASSPKTRTAATVPADERLAETSLLKLDDFPNGWTAKDSKEDNEDGACAAVNDAKHAVSGRASSPDFAHGGNTTATQAIYVYRTVGEARRYFGPLAGAELRDCFRKEFKKAFESDNPTAGVKYGDISTGELKVEPAGDENAAARFEIPVETKGIDVYIYIDVVVARTGRALSIMLFSDALTEFDLELRAKLTGVAVEHLQAGLCADCSDPVASGQAEPPAATEAETTATKAPSSTRAQNPITCLIRGGLSNPEKRGADLWRGELQNGGLMVVRKYASSAEARDEARSVTEASAGTAGRYVLTTPFKQGQEDVIAEVADCLRNG